MNGMNDGVIRNVGELKYWSWCWSTKYRWTFSLFQSISGNKLLLNEECSFKDYIKKWNLNWSSIDNDHNPNEVVLIEKSANYIREPHTAKLVGFYSEIAPIK